MDSFQSLLGPWNRFRKYCETVKAKFYLSRIRYSALGSSSLGHTSEGKRLQKLMLKIAT